MSLVFLLISLLLLLLLLLYVPYRLRWAGHVARMEEGRNAFRVLTGNRPLGSPRRRWEDNITMDLK